MDSSFGQDTETGSISQGRDRVVYDGLRKATRRLSRVCTLPLPFLPGTLVFILGPPTRSAKGRAPRNEQRRQVSAAAGILAFRRARSRGQ